MSEHITKCRVDLQPFDIEVFDMRKPIKVTTAREHANSGDVIITIEDALGDKQTVQVPGDCTPFSALRALEPFFEALFNRHVAPPRGEPELVTDLATNEVSVVLDGVELSKTPLPVTKAVELAPETRPEVTP